MSIQCAVIGAGQTKFDTQIAGSEFQSLLFTAVTNALEDAGIELSDVDSFVLSEAPDALHGLGHPEQYVPGILPINGRPLLRIHTGGATGSSAAHAGIWQIMSGEAECVLVMGVEKMGDNSEGAQRVLNMIWDTAYESLLPLNTIAMTGIQATRYMSRYGATLENYAVIASRLRENGVLNKYAHLRKAITPSEVLETPVLAYPIFRGMTCPRSSGGCAIILASESFVRRHGGPRAWVSGLSARSNTYWIGDRLGDPPNDYSEQYELRLAAREAYRMAGIDRPRDQIDLVEPYVPFSTQEPPVLEALDLCDPGQAAKLAMKGHWDRDGKIPVNPSGGVMCTNPIAISALVRVAEAAQQVRGRAGAHQVDGVRNAVATGAGGSIQFAAVTILSAEQTA